MQINPITFQYPKVKHITYTGILSLNYLWLEYSLGLKQNISFNAHMRDMPLINGYILAVCSMMFVS